MIANERDERQKKLVCNCIRDLDSTGMSQSGGSCAARRKCRHTVTKFRRTYRRKILLEDIYALF